MAVKVQKLENDTLIHILKQGFEAVNLLDLF